LKIAFIIFHLHFLVVVVFSRATSDRISDTSSSSSSSKVITSSYQPPSSVEGRWIA
jgi:hypothetical protein